jgi:2'-5' RNA ligase
MEMQYYRTFLALPVKAGADLLEIRKELRYALEDERISWVDPTRFHVTLRFLGNTRIEDVERISRALKEDEFRPDARVVSMCSLGSFGPRKKPRVIWVGFDCEEWFKEVKEGVDELLEELGFPRQETPFTAHLTLGRVRSLRDPARYREVLQEMKTRICETVCFDRLVYYRSILGSDGPEYMPLENISFRKE